MNLKEALEELTKRPKSVIGPGGESIPALHYTEHTHAALSWLCDRYNDGTLQVIGYDPMETTREKRLATFDKRRKGHVVRDGELPLTEFIKISGIQAKTAKKVAYEAGALFKIGYYLYVNIPKFYESWDEIQTNQDSYIDVPHTAKMLNVPFKEVRRLLKEGLIYEKPLAGRPHQISVNSIKAYLEKKGAEQDGENNSNNGEVH